MDEEALDNYLSDLCSPTKIKGKSLNFEITLPFIKISATGEFSRDISSLSKRQKCILFERLLEKNETVFFGSEDKEFAHDMQRNTIVRFRSKLKIPEMIELINGANSFLSGKFSDFMVTEIEKSSDDKNQTQILLSVLSERQSTVPVIFDEKIGAFSEIAIESIENQEEIDFWDTVAEEECIIIAKISKNYMNPSKVLIYDLGKSIFKLSRAIRRQIKDYEKNSAFNIFENGISYKLEIICIKL